MASLHPLERELLGHLRRQPLTRPGDRVLVAVSGGSDSLALLRLLHALRSPLGLSLEVVHFDHGLRPESGTEAQWVAAQAEALGLPFHLRRHGELARRASGVQAAARAWRREEGQRLLEERGAQWIATGHQRDDHLETLLLKLLRGVHLAHIRGLAPRAGRWIRPLLPFSRAALRAYLGDRGERWLEDSSNVSPRYKRNRVRAELVPLLEALTGGALERRLETLERQSAALAGWLESLPAPPQSDPAAAGHWIDAAALAGLPRLARSARLHAFLQERLPGAVDAGTLERAALLLEGERSAWELDLSARRVLKRRGTRLLLERREGPAAVREHTLGPWRLRAPEDLGLTLREGSCGEGEGLAIHNLDPDTPLEVRARRRGDRFHLPGREHPVKVADFLRDRGVPPWQRDRTPLVVAGGRVVAVYPLAVARGHELPLGEGKTLCLTIGPTD